MPLVGLLSGSGPKVRESALARVAFIGIAFISSPSEEVKDRIHSQQLLLPLLLLAPWEDNLSIPS